MKRQVRAGYTVPAMRKLLGVLLGLLLLVVAVQLARRGREPQASARTSQRIVSLAPNLTSLLFRLGVGDRLVGVTDYCDDPAEASRVPSVGDFLNPNFERIVSLDPDLVLAESSSSSKTVQRLRGLGLPVREVASPASFAEITRLIARVGELVGRQTEAAGLVGELERRVQAVRERGRALAFRPSVYLEIDLPTWTVGGPSFTSEALEICGARNLFADLARPASQVSAEVIVQRNPDVIVSFVASREQIEARPGWSRITAVQRGRIVDDFDEDLLSRANHRVVDGMEAFQDVLSRVMGPAAAPPVEGASN